MARRINEEKVTKLILGWLEMNGWKIICYDFPQSGTGFMLHPNSDFRETTKNKGAIIPDIIAVKGNIAVIFENKDRFVLSDFRKINELRTRKNYSISIDNLLFEHQIEYIFFGVGLPYQNRYLDKINKNTELVDFIILIDEDGQIRINYEISKIF
jgi:Holliday junction resolvase